MKVAELIAKILADNLRALIEKLEKRVDDAVAAKAIPPFALPQQWQRGARCDCRQVVRHRNGVFFALADTTSEPGKSKDGAWLPIMVGVAEIHASIAGRRLSIVIEQSDGKLAELSEDLPIPIHRGLWDGERQFVSNDMVTATGSIWHALRASKGVKPGTDGSAEDWRMVVKSGAFAPPVKFSLDEKSCVLSIANGDDAPEALGSIKPALYEALQAAGVLSPNQVRALEGLAPLEGAS